MFSIFGGFDKHKFKTSLTMAAERIKLHRNKRKNELKIERKEIGRLMGAKDFDRARIKVEGVIRKERDNEGEETLELMCDLLAGRFALIASEKACPADLTETVHTVIWAAKRTSIEELGQVREQLVHKYGNEFAAPALKGEGSVNARVKNALSVAVPTDAEVIAALESIAKEFNVAFNPKEDLKKSMAGLPPMSAEGAATAPGAAAGGSSGGSGGAATAAAGAAPAAAAMSAAGAAGGAEPSFPPPAEMPVPVAQPVGPGGMVYFDPMRGVPMAMPAFPGGAHGYAPPGYPYPYGAQPYGGIPSMPAIIPGVPAEPFGMAAASPGYTYPSPVGADAPSSGFDDGAGDVHKPARSAGTVAPPPGTAAPSAGPLPPSYEATIAGLAAAGIIQPGSQVTVIPLGTEGAGASTAPSAPMNFVASAPAARHAEAPQEPVRSPNGAAAAGHVINPEDIPAPPRTDIAGAILGASSGHDHGRDDGDVPTKTSFAPTHAATSPAADAPSSSPTGSAPDGMPAPTGNAALDLQARFEALKRMGAPK